MEPLDAMVAQLESIWKGKTLATLRDDAERELNGTCFQALRPAPGPRRVLILCVTGEHEIRKLGKLDPEQAQRFGDWSKISLFEAVARAITLGGFAYDFDRSDPKKSAAPVVLIAASTKSVTTLEGALGLQP